MVRVIARAAQSWPIVGICAAYLAFRVVVWAWPADYWLDVRRVVVVDGPADADVLMTADRVIRRPFRGTYLSVIRRQTTDETTGGVAWEIHCRAPGWSDYLPSSRYPDPLTLRWWTDGQCPTLVPGVYLLTTTWVIEGDGLLPDKTVQTVSNIFTIGIEKAGR